MSGADHIHAADADLLTALTTSGGDAEAATPSRGLARHVSSLAGAAVLAIAAAVLAVGLAGGAAPATAASIPESEPLAAADAENAVDEVLADALPDDVDLELGPIYEGRWEYSFAPVQWTQRDAVLAVNLTPPPQPEGYGWALVELAVRNVGAEEATPGRFEVVLHTGGWAVSHLEVGRQPLRMPGEYAAQLLQPGEQTSGNLGFWLPDHASDSSDCVIELRVYPSTDASYTSHWIACR